jgi:hypothetical protein
VQVWDLARRLWWITFLSKSKLWPEIPVGISGRAGHIFLIVRVSEESLCRWEVRMDPAGIHAGCEIVE